ncbi:type II toxin-antitoxin system RelE/ParE family toxin [Candidatus Wolfebacteria bacterium]|nr:type II toxin-antitoxin system RelE/ParE family toxin [Candidatus Wolfebacteria bacterium]
MEYQLRLKPRAEKELNSLSRKDYYKILTVLTGLAKNPFSGKKLEGEYRGYYSTRAWPYRIIYQAFKKELIVLIIYIGHRQGVYK